MENLFTPRSIRTVSGKYVNVFEPDPDTLCIEDIAHALAHQPRFGGHLPDFFSVAQHSIMCAETAFTHNKFNALMHDASEAYLLDIPRPIKLELSNYKEIENGLMLALAKKFGFEWPMNDSIKGLDDFHLRYEFHDLMLGQQFENCPRIIPMSPRHAKKCFLTQFELYSKTYAAAMEE
jgi:hypothetical protein